LPTPKTICRRPCADVLADRDERLGRRPGGRDAGLRRARRDVRRFADLAPPDGVPAHPPGRVARKAADTQLGEEPQVLGDRVA
jgi:hypothetical protein